MAVTWADVVLLDPALAAVPVPAQNAILSDTSRQLSTETWDTKFDLAHKYLAAHCGILYLRGSAGLPGAVSKERVGEVERDYSVPQIQAHPNSLDETIWGREFQRLLRGCLSARLPLVV